MKKKVFFEELRKGLSGLPQSDVKEHLNFYREMIDDRMEEGVSEEEAVSSLGIIDKIVAQIIEDIPLSKTVKEKITPKKKLSVWEIVLLILGSPIWLPVMIAALLLFISLYVVLWSVIIFLWAFYVSIISCVLGSIIAGVAYICGHNTLTGISMIGIGTICLGLSIFLFYGCKAATKGTLLLTKKMAVNIKNYFIKKEKI